MKAEVRGEFVVRFVRRQFRKHFGESESRFMFLKGSNGGLDMFTFVGVSLPEFWIQQPRGKLHSGRCWTEMLAGFVLFHVCHAIERVAREHGGCIHLRQ